MPFVKVRNFKMYYEVEGKGFPLIFVHGLGGDSRNWTFQIPVFAEKYRVYAIDLRGHGRSEAPDTGYSLDSFTEDVAQFLKIHGIQKCRYAGLSMGGMIGQSLAVTHPELLESLVLVDTSPSPGMKDRPGYEDAVKLFENSAETAEKHGREPLADITLKMMFTGNFIENNPEIIKKVRELIVEGPTKGYVNAIRNIFLTDIDIYPRLEEIDVPTLIIVGRQDVLTPIEQSERLKNAIKNSELEIIENSGHVSNIEQREEFNRILAGFLKKMDSKRYKAPEAVLNL